MTIKHEKQKGSNDCWLACISMLVDKDRAIYPDSLCESLNCLGGFNYTYISVRNIISDINKLPLKFGNFFDQCKEQCFLSINPFVVHIHNPINDKGHFIIVVSNGEVVVYDPELEGPVTFEYYDKKDWWISNILVDMEERK